ncbi:mCG54218, isoform CRA_a [Mus musculus]|nr:mCG54218, isoform CRA_a [Mus musculus]EDL20197.1 mCG54218, isoform CRA_a [Mus musculus]
MLTVLSSQPAFPLSVVFP